MARDTRTVEELEAAAMLLGDGWWYDRKDHTFNFDNEAGLTKDVLCADTMAVLFTVGMIDRRRRDDVKQGLIGPKIDGT